MRNIKFPKEPVWKGPYKDGITQTLLGKFIVCRDRFWLKAICGLVDREGFDHKLEYGSLWHAAEEYHGNGKPWTEGVMRYADWLCRRYPEDTEKIKYWATVCKTQFPVYLEFSKRLKDNDRKIICTERCFAVPYTLPSGRTVLLRGKFDEIYRIGPLIYLKENKAKGEIDVEGHTKTVAYNLQTMLYQIAMRSCFGPTPLHPASGKGYPRPKNGSGQFDFGEGLGTVRLPDNKKPYRINGVLYNVIRRPLSDRFAIKQKKGRLVKNSVGNKVRKGAESTEDFMRRLGRLIKANAHDYFYRWLVTLNQQDIDLFRHESFDPILEQLCDWWEWVAVDPFDPWRPRTKREVLLENPNYKAIAAEASKGSKLMVKNKLIVEHFMVQPQYDGMAASPHYRTPFGVYNALASGFRGEYFDFLTSGRTYDLNYTTNLFPELS